MKNYTSEQHRASNRLDRAINRLAEAEDAGKPSVMLYRNYLKALKEYKKTGLSLLDLL
jgi:hypothetical protein